MSPIGLAVIGAGYWGPNLVRAALATPDIRLRWLCDLDLDRARACWATVRRCAVNEFLRGVLADPEVAAVAIATPAERISISCEPPSRPGRADAGGKPLTRIGCRRGRS